jgi:prolyl oligopeptidase
MQTYHRRFTLGVSVVLFLSFILLLPACKAPAGPEQDEPTLPPVAPVRPVVDNYYGTKVVDQYRYMENLKDPEVQAWMKAQNDYTRAVLARLPGREQLLARIRQLDQSVPQVQAQRLPGDVYLILKRLPTENMYKLYIRRGLKGQDRLLVDPERVTLAAPNRSKGKNAIMYFAASRDIRYLAVGIAPGGSERDTEMHVFETDSGRETADVIPRAWGGSPNWLPDNHSFAYGKLQKLPPGAPATDIEQKIRAYLHVLGTDAEKDPAVFGYGVVPSIKVDPRHLTAVVAQPNSGYALGVITTGVSPNNAFYIEPVADLGKTNSAWRKVADFSDDVSDIEIHGNDLYLLTYKNALRYKVVRIDARHPRLASAETIVPPGQAVVTGINPAQDALYVQLLDGGLSRVLRVPYGAHPRAQEVALPFQGSAYVGTDPRVPGALLYLTSWTKAFRIYAYDPDSRRAMDTKLQPWGPYDNPANVESLEVKVRSYDGTLVPLSITYPKDMKRDGSNPTLLEGYGAYGFPSPPYFDSMRLAWYENGGVYAVCHVRGGGEYGEEWHLAGKGNTKPNTWRDFVACAQYLIDNKYSSPAHLAGEGGSAGGILIGRSITSRPDLFGAAIDVVGCSDTLRMETTANGVPNIAEFGSVKTEAGFKALYAMSSYDHIQNKTAYPAVLLETGANDPRVDPWQMAKMAARLQATSSSGKPVLLRVEYHGGHGGIGGTEEQAQERLADDWSFLLWQFGAKGFQPKKQ